MYVHHLDGGLDVISEFIAWVYRDDRQFDYPVKKEPKMFVMNGKTYKVVDDGPRDFGLDVCEQCAFKDDSQSCAGVGVGESVDRQCYDFPQQHYEEVQ